MKQAMWREARNIFAQIAPAMSGEERGSLMGGLVSACGGGARGATIALNTLRDVQVRIMSQALPGYAVAETPAAKVAVIRRYIRKIINDTKNGQMPPGGRSGREPSGSAGAL